MHDVLSIIYDLNLDDGETKRITCPACHSRGTFTVSNVEGNIVWNCYKASCNLRGAKKGRMTVDAIRRKLAGMHSTKIDMDFELPPHVLHKYDEQVVVNFSERWGIEITKLLYDVKEARIVFPVYYNGTMVDAVGRSTDGRKPKWRRYGASDVPFTAGHTKIVIVVEDAISAAVVNEQFPKLTGMALMGTALTNGSLEFLIDKQPNVVVIALDPDARSKEFAIMRNIRGALPDTMLFACNLTDDLKYCNRADMVFLDGIEKEYKTWN